MRAADTSSAMRGDLSHQPFAELLAELDRNKSTGALLLRRSKIKKIVYFREGTPHSIKSNLLSECLGRILVRERFISEAEYQESLKRMMASGRRQGAVLVDMGCISEQNLQYALALQMRAKLLDLFSWSSGEYQFNPEAALPSEGITLDLSMTALIYEGARACLDEERIGTQLGAVNGLHVGLTREAADPTHKIGLGDEERGVFAAIDGRKTVSDLKALDLLAESELERLLYAMKCTRLIRFSDSPVGVHSRFDLQ
jgi:hypothetical protein